MKIIVQNLAVEYQDEGSGPVLLFLHGWQDTLHSFDALALTLSSSWRIVRLDLPGFGGSEFPPCAWHLDDYIKFVQDFLAKLELQPYALVGHSFGGRIIIKGQANHTFNAQKIILIGSAGIAKRKTASNLALNIVAKVGGAITKVPPLSFWREKMRQKLYKKIGSDYLGAGALRETFLNVIKEDLSAWAEKIQTPALLVWGSADTETPLADGERLATLISGSDLKTIAGATHFVHQEKPTEVADYLKKFLC